MKRVLLLISVFGLGTAQVAQAQLADNRPGYRLSLTGDTVRGFVNDRGGRRNALECHFQLTPTSPAEVYTPKQLGGYGFLDAMPKHYRVLIVPGGPAEAVASAAASPLFMDVVVSGTASLYYRIDENARARYYLQASPGVALEELWVDTRQIEQGGRAYSQPLNYYRQSLELAFRDCPEVQQKVARTAFTLPALAALVTAYNQCRATQAGGPAVTAVPLQRSWMVRSTVVVGARVATTLKVDSDHSIVGYNQEITQKFSPVAGFQLLLNNSRFSRSLWLNLGASADYQSFSSAFTSTLTTAVQTQVTVRTNTNYEAIMLRLPLLLRLGRPQGVVRPYVEAGVAANFPVEQKNSIVNVGYGPSGEHQWLGSSSLFYPSFIGSVGLDVDRPNCHRIGVAMRYEGGRGPSNLIYTTTKITSGQLLFTYALGK